MSVRIMAEVFERYQHGGGEMLLALALADHADDNGTNIYPSIKNLAAKTRQSARTVQYQLRRMQEAGWLLLVGFGNGGRSKTTEYRISPLWLKGAEIAPIEKGATDDIKGATDDTKGCNPRQKRVQPVAPASNHHRTIIEPSRNSKRKSASAFDRPNDVSEKTWHDWVALRKAKRAAITGTAIDGIRRESEKAGLSLEAALAYCCAQGWQGFNAGWYRQRITDTKKTPQTAKYAAAAVSIFGKPDSQREVIDV